MKYLKLFENHSYYWEITPLEYYDRLGIEDSGYVDQEFIDKYYENLNDNEISEIKNNIDENKYKLIEGSIKKIRPPEQYYGYEIVDIAGYPRIYCDIEKLKDEWYYVCDMRMAIHYKCDQLEGLIDCIKFILSKQKGPEIMI